ncbi:hypothetical protein PTTG_09655 [Puccinia triticina 1-1 BBBD Race 1]|uniref:Uncharacterized protein n=2 Tax=Puccinia triticina TaxID=208348 RepID=A0A180GAQ1_PUCT1|nr:uncharacterized protein PtA15_7A11 [Puccinia triticina]OAV89412.1 hypothetical protein PTTG_09655 [Puccinia triticina 1-1 BBBD Race 1]WAQ86285.1 hypothetical protein PtA15_7A11 [Puccinia triticina]
MTTTLQPNLIHNSQFQSSTPFNRTSCLTSPLSAQATTPRTPSIRFAPLPDPRASRANVPGGFGGSDVWWSREEKADGTWGDYRLVVRRPNGEIIAIDDLALGSHERTQALETYRQQQTRITAPALIKQPNNNNTNNCPDSNDPSIRPSHNGSQTGEPSNPPDQSTSSQSESRFAKLLPPLVTQSSIPTSTTPAVSLLTPAGSGGPSIPLTLTRTTSRESTYSNHSTGSNYKAGSSSSLTRKFIEAMKKPLARHSHRLTPTNSLPISCGDLGGDSHHGVPLCKSRSDESSGSVLRGFTFGRLKKHPSAQLLRRTRSKDETTFVHPSQIPLDEPPTRRRSNYPPVAQRKAHMGGGRGGAGKLTLTEEPDFVEWKPAAAAPSPGGVDAPRQVTGSVDDDGSGMAWLRKRKREREERAQREEEERLRELRNSSTLIPSSSTTADQSVAGTGPNPIFPIREEDKPEDDRASTSSSISQSSILSRDGPQRSAGTRTSTSSATDSSKHSVADDEDLNEEELREEERLKLLVLAQSPFVRGATEVYRDREHHQVMKKPSELTKQRKPNPLFPSSP